MKNPYKGKNETPVGVLPADIAERHKLTAYKDVPAQVGYRRAYYYGTRARKIKYMFQLVKTYRQFVHGCHEKRLAQPLRDAVHHLICPLTRDNDSGGGDGGSAKYSHSNNTNDFEVVQEPLKV